jgi:hypothetical protein
MVILGPWMTSATIFQPLAGADRAKVAIFDHPQIEEWQICVFWVSSSDNPTWTATMRKSRPSAISHIPTIDNCL